MYPLFFFLFAAAAIGFAVNLLLQRQPIYSALSLLGVMASLASLYLLLGAEFVAAVQVLVYAGTILVLMVSIIMLLRAGNEPRTRRRRLARQVGAPLIVMLIGLFVSVVHREIPGDAVVRFGDFPGQTAGIGLRLFLSYLLHFEIASILLLVAIIGAVVLAPRDV